MGQYYKALLIDGHGERQSLGSHTYSNGSKLLEHSYIGNLFVNAVMNRIYYEPQRVAWIGDYSKDWNEKGFDLGGGFVKNKKDFQKYYNACWSSKVGVDEKPCFCVKFSEPFYCEDFLRDDYYLINHTMHEYISFKDHVARNAWEEEWEGKTYLSCLHPLPLLTAVGNNQGGGDYYSNHVGYYDIGSWAFDLLSIRLEPPQGDDWLCRKLTFAKNI